MENNNLPEPKLSLVVPIYNEKDSIKPLVENIVNSLDGFSFEIIFVDDGSTDGSCEIIKSIIGENANFKLIQLRRNFGQTAALAAGFDHSKGEILIPIDADMQNDPSDIPKLLEKIEEGYDIVSGWRKKRNDPLSKRIPSKIANFLISIITGVHLHDYGCTLKAYKKDVVKNINLYGEMHRFIPALASWNGVNIAEIQVQHHPRKFGKTKYGLSRTFREVLDLITVKFLLSFSTKPIQLFGTWGILSLFLSGACGIMLIILKLVQGKDMTGNPLLYLAILFSVLGIQIIMMGLLGEMMARIYHESRNHPTYLVKDSL